MEERIELGLVGETGRRTIEFRLTEFKDLTGSYILIHQRSKDHAPYVVQNMEVAGDVMKWHINATDTACEGTGYAEIQLISGNTLVAKSERMETYVGPSLGIPDEPKAYTQVTLDAVLKLVAQVIAYMNAAAGYSDEAKKWASYSAHAPIIGTNGNWFLWDGEQYVDSGVSAEGEAGHNGYTFIPHIENNVLSWTNDGGLPNPDPITITAEVTPTVIVNELYSEYGAIADLIVDELRTDYQKAQRYLDSDTSKIDYLHIYDEEIDFITGSVAKENDVPLTEQLHHNDLYFYWTDSTKTQMTSKEVTAYPVIVYQYNELIKGTYHFVTEGESTNRIPELVFGAGSGSTTDPDRGKGFIRKNNDSFDVWYVKGNSDHYGMFIGDYTDLVGLRKPTELDFSSWDSGLFVETLDGDLVNSFTVTFDEDDNPVTFTDGAGHETEVVW